MRLMRRRHLAAHPDLIMSWKDAAYLTFTALENNACFESFKDLGFVQRPCTGSLFAYFDESCSGVARDASKWFITLGDSDLLYF